MIDILIDKIAMVFTDQIKTLITATINVLYSITFGIFGESMAINIVKPTIMILMAPISAANTENGRFMEETTVNFCTQLFMIVGWLGTLAGLFLTILLIVVWIKRLRKGKIYGSN